MSHITLGEKNTEVIQANPRREAIAEQNLEDRVGFLYVNTPCAKYRRVSEYYADGRSQALINELLPSECAKGVAITVGMTTGGALLGVGVGGLTAGPPGAVVGGIAGGLVGFGVGSYLATQVMKQPFREHYKAWKAGLRDEKLFEELYRVSKEDPAFEACLDPITLERFESPYMITQCGHTFEADQIANLLALSVLQTAECPLCRTGFTKADVEVDIVMIAKMKIIYSELASREATADNYSEQIKEAFTAMAKDSQQQIENIYTECAAELLVKFKEKQIAFRAYQFKKNELDDKFKDFLT